jgi:hypothetical protein
MLVEPWASELKRLGRRTDVDAMQITDVASTSLLAKSLDGVRAVVAQAQSAPSTPEAQAAVILQLSSAAQNLVS